MSRILFTTPVFSHPPIGGPSLRIWNTVKALARFSELSVSLRVTHSNIGGDPALALLKQTCREVHFTPSAQPAPYLTRKARSLARNIFKSKPPQAKPAQQETEADFAAVLQTAIQFCADVIWLGFGNISYPLLKYIKTHSRIPAVVDTDSIWSRYLLRGLPYATDKAEQARIHTEGKAKEEEERWGTEMAEVTTAVSEVDAQYYRSFAPSPDHVRIFSNVVDVDSYSTAVVPEGFKHPSLRVATFWPDSPMEVGTRWLIDKVMPLVWAKEPRTHLYVIGNGSQSVLADIKEPRIDILGKVHSVVPWLSHANVSLVPLHFESGTRFKILESGACRRPVVSTTLAAEGLAVVDKIHGRIADSPEDFAQAILDVLENESEGRRYGENLHQLVSSRYSLKSLQQEARDILDFIENQRASVRGPSPASIASR